jgi:nucleotide-binding universal stress UspA family protein
MNWHPIIAGVDSSPAGINAALVALELSRMANTQCHLVHGIDGPRDTSFLEPQMGRAEYDRVVLAAAGTLLRQALKDRVPGSALERLEVRIGSAAAVLSAAAEELDAELVVLGGKHRSAIGRWLAGSTAHDVVRALERPLLVTGPSPGSGPLESGYSRVLAAIDLSPASQPTLDGAERVARLSGARLQVLHAVERFAMLPGLAPGLDDYTMQRAEADFELSAWPQTDFPHADVVRRGPAAETIAEAATDWAADLVVVGSHNRGWVSRRLFGSVTEQLLNRLPASLLVIPVCVPELHDAGAPGDSRHAAAGTSA